MSLADEMRRCLEECDVVGARRVWAHVYPDMPQLESDDDLLIVIHRARTETKSVSLKARAYSHYWLEERGFPSGLPDELRLLAQHLYPRVVEGVGVSVNFTSPFMKPAKPIIEAEIGDAIENCYADGTTEPEYMQKIIRESKDRAMKRLFGKWRPS